MNKFFIVSCALIFSLSACRESTQQKSREAVDAIGEDIERTAEEIGEEAKKAGDKIEEGVRKLDRKLEKEFD